LDKKDAEHRALLLASASKKAATTASIDSHSNDTDQHLIAEAKRKGIQINDNNEVVDKRDLLGAGLNVATRPKFGTFGSLASSDARIKERQDEYEAYKRKKVAEYDARRRNGRGDHDERERLSKEIEQQMVATKRKAEQDQADKEAALQAAAAARRTTEDAALSARERYLARKKQKSTT
jgi:hypothetical protein